MQRIFRIPLEALPERYTVQWSKWFPSVFEKEGFEYYEIPGEQLSSTVDVGKVLDAAGTMHFKFTQMSRIAKQFKQGYFKNGDIFFIDDIQFPGAWSIKYMAHLYGIDIKLYGFLHASSYTIEDFAAPMSHFMSYVEKSWVDVYDGIFFATKYHVNAYVNRRNLCPLLIIPGKHKKLHVTGAPWYTYSAQQLAHSGEVGEHTRKRQVIFPNRFDIEKRPNVFLKVAYYIYHKLGIKDIDFVITTSRKELTKDISLKIMLSGVSSVLPNIKVLEGLTKEEYYKELSKSKLMFTSSIEENFGYCAVEALSLNTPILAPNNCSHPELVQDLDSDLRDLMLYDYYQELLEAKNDFAVIDESYYISELSAKVVEWVNSTEEFDVTKAVLKYNNSIKEICSIIKKESNC